MKLLKPLSGAISEVQVLSCILKISFIRVFLDLRDRKHFQCFFPGITYRKAHQRLCAQQLLWENRALGRRLNVFSAFPSSLHTFLCVAYERGAKTYCLSKHQDLLHLAFEPFITIRLLRTLIFGRWNIPNVSLTVQTCLASPIRN